MDMPTNGNLINEMMWDVITIPDSGRSFLTSDYPIYLSKGIQREDAYFALPISPRKIFVASKSQAELDRLKAMSIADITHASNKVVVRQARKYVYGTSEFERNFVSNNLGAI